jgi:hypothetical protein
MKKLWRNVLMGLRFLARILVPKPNPEEIYEKLCYFWGFT